MDGHIPEGGPGITRNPDQVCCRQIQERCGKQKSMLHSYQGVDNTRRLCSRCREDLKIGGGAVEIPLLILYFFTRGLVWLTTNLKTRRYRF
jgi:hypothetical protein